MTITVGEIKPIPDPCKNKWQGITCWQNQHKIIKTAKVAYLCPYFARLAIQKPPQYCDAVTEQLAAECWGAGRLTVCRIVKDSQLMDALTLIEKNLPPSKPIDDASCNETDALAASEIHSEN